MARIREFEVRVGHHFREGDIHGFVHTSVGQEAVAACACAQLREDDFITTTHRGHGHCIAKGADPRDMMAELFGRAAVAFFGERFTPVPFMRVSSLRSLSACR
jgi:acetoin:2,6-dichlorophenolindophenol oxidoreductase subunit alpha